AFTRGRMRRDSKLRRSSISIPTSASTAAPAFQSARGRRYSLSRICRRSGQISRRLTRTGTRPRRLNAGFTCAIGSRGRRLEVYSAANRRVRRVFFAFGTYSASHARRGFVRPFKLDGVGAEAASFPRADITYLTVVIVVPPLSGNRIRGGFTERVGSG